MQFAPNLNEGDRVRVMQTNAMVTAGLANKAGSVLSARRWDDESQVCTVGLDGGPIVEINSAHLMRQLAS